MRFADLTARIAGKSVDTWQVHYRAMERFEAGEDIYLMSVGQESELPSPPGVVDAAIQSMKRSRHHYTAVQGDPALRRAVATRYAEDCGREIDPDCVVIFAGAQNALFAAAQVLLQSGDEAILIEPYYTTYPATMSASGATLVGVALDPAHGFRLDPERVIDAITPRTRAILVNTPNNPSGAVYDRAPLQALVDACREREIWMISDEVYMDIVDHPARCRPYALPGAEQVMISVSSVSKSHRMTGWRIGWAVGPPEFARHCYNLNMCMSYGLPGFTQDAAAYALQHERRVTAEIAAQLTHRRRVVTEGLSGIPRVSLHGDGGGMFLIMDIRELGLDSMEFSAGLLAAEAVSVQSCSGFGASCDGLVRISAVLSEDRLREACRRIARYVGSL